MCKKHVMSFEGYKAAVSQWTPDLDLSAVLCEELCQEAPREIISVLLFRRPLESLCRDEAERSGGIDGLSQLLCVRVIMLTERTSEFMMRD